jgi:hypothetical protein
MLAKNNHREPHEWPNSHPAGVHPLPPHLLDGVHQPPHIRASKIHLNYDESAIKRLNAFYDDVEYVIEILETCPPEIKLTLAMALGISIDLSEYPETIHPLVRFATPFLNDNNSELIGSVLNCAETEAAKRIYNVCPPEQALLAVAVATLIKTKGEA